MYSFFRHESKHLFNEIWRIFLWFSSGMAAAFLHRNWMLFWGHPATTVKWDSKFIFQRHFDPYLSHIAKSTNKQRRLYWTRLTPAPHDNNNCISDVRIHLDLVIAQSGVLSGMRNLHAWWRKRRRSDRSYRKTSWRHFYIWLRRIAAKTLYNFLQDFGKRKHCLYEHPVEFSSKKTDDI
jgi:ABC-type oligopeptide transport system ATPase subunit